VIAVLIIGFIVALALGVGVLYLLHLVQTGREAKTSLAIAHHHTRALTAAIEIAQVRAETQRQLYEAAWQQGQRL